MDEKRAAGDGIGESVYIQCAEGVLRVITAGATGGAMLLLSGGKGHGEVVKLLPDGTEKRCASADIVFMLG